ncbi:Peptidase S8/S53, subtilisin/kexin/sedolisin [Moelleriella libera RCEF 2490]|uniref:Peptidase S8/S53, subtilisin/kexin/sedolisin n=1 Tax=Moelleriella libera RCEF 2490 TaxID=1081109 RepID=A0A167Y9H8_9HYPO|nr:Peptidase S8/S53, subtilisin/kexin/sedolisin [Moelleriella libera RCEF 2490]
MANDGRQSDKVSAGLSEFLRLNSLRPDSNQKHRGAAIHLAVKEGKTQHVEELLRHFRSDCIDAKDQRGERRGRTPIHNAASQGLNEIILSLLKHGANVHARTTYGWTALLLACRNNRVKTAKILLSHGASLADEVETKDQQSSSGLKAVHFAAGIKNPALLLELLRRDAKIDDVTPEGDTPLHIAVKFGSIACFTILLFHGASHYVTNKKGLSSSDLVSKLKGEHRSRFQQPLKYANERDTAPFAAYRNKLGKEELVQAIHQAAQLNSGGGLLYLLQVDPTLVEKTRDNDQLRPLHVAAMLGNVTAVAILLEHNADINCRGRAGWTPLMFAADNGHGDTVKVLLESHADIMLRNEDGDIAARLAKNSGFSFDGLLPMFNHVHRSHFQQLSAPHTVGRSREPSPRWIGEPKGELFAKTDAKVGSTSNAVPHNSPHKELFETLERVWYERIQWCPEDDKGKRGADEWSGPVKIAILDTGIDLGHDDFQRPSRRRTAIGQRAAKHLPEEAQRDRIKVCKNFVGSKLEDEDVVDTDGHGTHIAGVILSIAPRAELYIAKVSSGQGHINGEDTASGIESAARREGRHPVQEALRWAIEQGVDIVNLSLGFPDESSSKLTSTLEEANHKGIIVFASASNQGNDKAIAWPARDPELAICITSGDELNNLSKFAPSGNNELPVFMTHGENVWSQLPTSLGGGFRSMSGTSVSTPIAVSMAAMILAFLNTTTHWSLQMKREWLSFTQERRLRRTRGMRCLLQHMCRDRSGFQVLSPNLMWERNPNGGPFQALGLMAEAFQTPG